MLSKISNSNSNQQNNNNFFTANAAPSSSISGYLSNKDPISYRQNPLNNKEEDLREKNNELLRELEELKRENLMLNNRTDIESNSHTTRGENNNFTNRGTGNYMGGDSDKFEKTETKLLLCEYLLGLFRKFIFDEDALPLLREV
jgi:hypothetical protein